MSQASVDINAFIRAVEQSHNQLAGQIDQVDTSVGLVRQDLNLTANELRELRAEFDAFVQTAARAAAVQQSETRVVNLKAELDRQFGHYGQVRRTSVGMLQAFDVGNVGNDIVRQVSEELMIQTPRYWLAPVIVTLAAWSRDNEEMAQKSVREAYSRDAAKTSLFFALVLRRQGRLEAANRWLQHYLLALDPRALGREFAVVLEATSYNAFGPAAQTLMTDAMATWCGELRTNKDIVEKQIQAWVREIGGRRDIVAPSAYPELQALSPEWPTVKRVLEQASAIPVMIDTYGDIARRDTQLPTVLEHLLDDILDQLVTEYDTEELPLRREVVYHEAVIEEGGDMTRARQRADRLQATLDETTDIVSLQTDAAISPELVGVSDQTQRIMIGVGRHDLRAAVARFCHDYRSQVLPVVTFSFDAQHSNYASTYRFQGAQLTSAMPEQDGVNLLRTVWHNTFAAYIDSISFKNSWYTKPGLIAGALALVLLMMNPMVGVVALLAGAGIVWFLGDQERKKCQAAVDAVEKIRAEAIEHSIARYRAAQAEFVDAGHEFTELDSQEGELLALIDTWPTANAEEAR